MLTMDTPPQSPAPPVPSRRHGKRALAAVGKLGCIYFGLAYILIPAAWRHHYTRHPALEQIPRICRTSNHIPGDPLNIALVGTEKEVFEAMAAAGWNPADPITLKTSLRIATTTVFKRPYEEAPVSNLYIWGHKQDLAFQQPVGNSPAKRHHVRFWRSPRVDDQGRPLWVGAATYDTRAGLSHTTLQITHHIGPDVDRERDKILTDLRQAGWVAEVYWANLFHDKLHGRNGGGDRYHTDGRLAVGVLTTTPEKRATTE